MLLSSSEILQYLNQTPGWEYDAYTKSISRIMLFNNFKESMNFVNKVSEIAEQHNHHPDITIQYSKVVLSLSTHSEGGLTEKDFIVAKAISEKI